jgi:GT2 family glycosyltransferase
MTAPRLLSVLLNWRTAQMTLRAAEACLREMEGIAGELVIVDNDSGDGSAEILRAAVAARGWSARARVIDAGRNGGFGAGNNVGIRAGLRDGRRPDFVYVLNSDAFPDPGALRGLLDFLQAHPRAGTAGSHVRGDDGAPHVTLFRFPTIASEFEMAAKTGPISRLLRSSIVPLPIPGTPQRIGWSAGASLMLRMDMLEQIGLFDEAFFLYYEETDLCFRARAAGWERWYVPQSRVVHIGSVSTGMKAWARTPQYLLDSRLHYFTKNHGRLYAALATGAAVLGGSVWRLRCLVTRRPFGGPRRFQRDLIAHFWRNAWRPRPAPGPTQ